MDSTSGDIAVQPPLVLNLDASLTPMEIESGTLPQQENTEDVPPTSPLDENNDCTNQESTIEQNDSQDIGDKDAFKGILKHEKIYGLDKKKVDFDMDIELIPYDSKEYTVDIQIVKEMPKKIVSYRELFKKMAEEEKATKDKLPIDEEEDEPIEVNPFSKLVIKEPPIHHSTNDIVSSHKLLKAATAQNEKNANFANICQQDHYQKENDNNIDNAVVERVKFSVTPVDEFAEYGTNQGIVQDILINHCQIVTNINNGKSADHSILASIDKNIPESSIPSLDKSGENSLPKTRVIDSLNNNQENPNQSDSHSYTENSESKSTEQPINEIPVVTKEFSIDVNYQPYLSENPKEEFIDDVNDETLFDSGHEYFYYDDASVDVFDIVNTDSSEISASMLDHNEKNTAHIEEQSSSLIQLTNDNKLINNSEDRQKFLLDDNDNNITNYKEFVDLQNWDANNPSVEKIITPGEFEFNKKDCEEFICVIDKSNLDETQPTLQQQSEDYQHISSLHPQDQISSVTDPSIDSKTKHSKSDICYTNGPVPEKHHHATLKSIKEERSVSMSFDDIKTDENELRTKGQSNIEENEIEPSSESVSASDKSNISMLMPVTGHLEWNISSNINEDEEKVDKKAMTECEDKINENPTDRSIEEVQIKDEPKTREIGVQTDTSITEANTHQCSCLKNKYDHRKKPRKSQRPDRIQSSSSSTSISEQFLNIFNMAEGISSENQEDKSISDVSEGNCKDFTQSTNLDCSSSMDSFETDENSFKLENNICCDTEEMNEDEENVTYL